MLRVIFSSVTCLYYIFPHHLIKFAIFGKKMVSVHKTCVLIFSANLSEACAITGRIRRTIIINVPSLRVNYLFFF